MEQRQRAEVGGLGPLTVPECGARARVSVRASTQRTFESRREPVIPSATALQLS